MGKSESKQSADTNTTTTYTTNYATTVTAGLQGADINNLVTTFAQSFLILEKDLANKQPSYSADVKSPYSGVGQAGTSEAKSKPKSPVNWTYILVGGAVVLLLLFRK